MAKAYLRDGAKEKARNILRRIEDTSECKSHVELMRLYGEAGEKEDVYRIWDMYKNTGKKDNEGFGVLIGSLLKLEDIRGAENIYNNEWECSSLEFDVRIMNMLVAGYRKKGMVEKADQLMKKTVKSRGFVRPITPFLEEMGEKGNEVMKPSDFRDLIKNLHDSKQFSKALEASSWMIEKRVFNVFPEDYATRLHLIETVLGIEEAEKFIETSIPENMKGYSVYAALLTSYTKSEKHLEKAEAIFKKMKELGFLVKLSPFKSMISLYSKLGYSVMVLNLQREMTEQRIEPDCLTINTVLRAAAEGTDVETMETYKRELVNADDKTKLDVRTRNAMAKAYERAGLILKAIEITGSTRQVYNLWDYKVINKDNEAYLTVINSLLKLDDVEGAEKMYKQWEPEGPEFDYRIPSLLLSHYCKDVYNEVKAMEVVESSEKKKKRMEFKLNIQLYKDFIFPG